MGGDRRERELNSRNLVPIMLWGEDGWDPNVGIQYIRWWQNEHNDDCRVQWQNCVIPVYNSNNRSGTAVNETKWENFDNIRLKRNRTEHLLALGVLFDVIFGRVWFWILPLVVRVYSRHYLIMIWRTLCLLQFLQLTSASPDKSVGPTSSNFFSMLFGRIYKFSSSLMAQ